MKIEKMVKIIYLLINNLQYLFYNKKAALIFLSFCFLYLKIIIISRNNIFIRDKFNSISKCDFGYKFVEKSCVINHSFEIIYKTFETYEKVILINRVYEKSIKELIIDNKTITPSYYYIFPDKGEHNIKILLYNDKIYKTDEMFYNNSYIFSFIFTELPIKNVSSMRGMFKNCINIKEINFSKIFYEEITDLSHMFENCNSLKVINNINLVNKKTKNISYMFANCRSLEILDLSKFNTDSINDMSFMFFGCSSLTSVNLLSFKTKNLFNIQSMFDGCSSITSLNLSFFEFDNIKNTNYMFRNCSKLNFLEFPSINSKHQKFNISNNFFGCDSFNSTTISKYESNLKKTNEFKNKYDICMVGIWWGGNYGSMITNYALYQAVSNMGYNILMIGKPSNKNYSKYITHSFYNISKPKKLSKLHELNEQCESFLVGSDQIWNTLLSRKFKQFYFLGFADDKKKKNFLCYVIWFCI